MKITLLLVLGIVVGLGCLIPDAGYREDIEILIVKEPVKRHPYQEEYEQMLYPVVRITSSSGTGSGVILDVTKVTTVTRVTGCCTPSPESVRGTCGHASLSFILTACHVVDNENTVNIELYNATIITGTVVITDTIKDLALIRPSGQVSYSAQLAPRKYTPYLFTPVWAMGCSLGLTPRPSQGIISAIKTDHWEITAPILPGNSGGPIYDARTYQVIGIAVWVKVYDGQLITTMAGIVPINQIYEFLKPQMHTD
ncbi:MAG: serine protease [Planctomycetota bacterium]